MASLTDAEETLRSTTPRANFQRLTRLLMCGGLKLLRETFDSIISPANLPSKLSDPATKVALKKARTTKPEWDKLYPSPGVYGKSTDFDITLIFRLLRTICNLTPPPAPRGWDDLPNFSDHSLEADLVRIKYYRNEVYGHNKTMEVSNSEFVDLWINISEALIRIAATIGGHVKKDEWKKAIDEFLVNPLTPEEERYIEELDTWYKQDMDVKIEVEKLSDTMDERFNTFTEDMRAGLDRIQNEVQSFRQEMAQSPRPVYTEGPVVIQDIYLISGERIPQAALCQSPEEGRSERMCNTVHANPKKKKKKKKKTVHANQLQELATGLGDNSGELQLNQPDPPTEITFWDVIVSFKEPLRLFLKYLRYKRNVKVCNHRVGSLQITVECSSLKILDDLWEDYRSGHLTDIAKEILVTAEVLERLSLIKMEIKTFISEEEYEKGKQIFMENSAQSEGSRTTEDYEEAVLRLPIQAQDTNAPSCSKEDIAEPRIKIQGFKVDKAEEKIKRRVQQPVEEEYNAKEDVLINLHITVARIVALVQSNTSNISSTNQLEQKAGSQAMCIVPMPLTEERKNCIWSAIMSVEELVESFLNYLRDKLHLVIGSYRIGIGSLLITVECRSFQILEGLLEDYRSGHLKDVAQEMFVTEEILKKCNLSEMKLKTFINEEEYQSCQRHFLRNSAQSEGSRATEDYEEPISRLSIQDKNAPSCSKEDIADPRIKIQGEQSLLERISKLQEENDALKKKVEALEQAMQHKVDTEQYF